MTMVRVTVAMAMAMAVTVLVRFPRWYNFFVVVVLLVRLSVETHGEIWEIKVGSNHCL